MSQRIAIAGMASAGGRDASLKADEIVFGLVSRALHEAGLRAQDVDLAMLSSMDLYDGRAISNGLLVPAAAGYLKDDSRIEADALLAVVGAAATIRARAAEVAVVVALHIPEVAAEELASSPAQRRFTDRISRFAFDAHHGRPVGMTASLSLALQAGHDADVHGLSQQELADRAARDISAGAASTWSERTSPVTAAEVLQAPVVAPPLTQLMLPGEAVGVVALVLASETRVARQRSVRGWITGWGTTNADHLSAPGWLVDPVGGTRAAAAKAYRHAGLADIGDVDVVEHTALTPALEPHVERALGLRSGDERVNRQGGALSCYPGLANGAYRLTRAVEHLEASSRVGGRAVVHSTDNLMGVVSASSAVMVLERA